MIKKNITKLRKTIDSLREVSEELLKVAEEKNDTHLINVTQAILNISKMLSIVVTLLETVYLHKESIEVE